MSKKYELTKKFASPSPRCAMGMASPLAVAPPGPALLWPLCAFFSLLLFALGSCLPPSDPGPALLAVQARSPP